MPARDTTSPHLKLPRTRVALLSHLAAPLTLLALWLPGCNDGDYRVDTGLYAALSRRIAENPTWETLWYPMLGEAPYFNKPPLAFWVHAAFIKLLGMDLWTVRLPTLLASMLAVFALQRAATLLGGRTAGLASAMVLALTLEFFRYTRAFSLDLWLVAFMLLGLWAIAATLRSAPTKPSLRRAILPGLAIGAALLVKPLYALFLPIAAATWLLLQAPRTSKPRWLFFCTAVAAIGIAVATPWYISMTLRWGEPFLQEHFIRQSLERATGGATTASTPGLLYLPAELFSTYWPWTLTLALALIAFARTGITPTRALERLGLTWSILLAIALTAFAGKRSRYLVPIYPGLAMLSGAWLSSKSPATLRRHARRATVLWAPTLPIIALAATFILPKLGIDFHEKPSGEIERLQALIYENESATSTANTAPPQVWAAPFARLEAAKLFAKGSNWAKPVGGLPFEQTNFPRTGDLVLYLNDALNRPNTLIPRPTDQPLGKFSGLFAVRVASDWTIADTIAQPEREAPNSNSPSPMNLWNRIFGSRSAYTSKPDTAPSDPHCVQIVIAFDRPDPDDETRQKCFDLQDEIASVLTDSATGELDGDLWGGNQCVIYCYGPDAQRMWDAIAPVLKRFPFPKGSYAIKRFGGPDVGREERISLPS